MTRHTQFPPVAAAILCFPLLGLSTPLCQSPSFSATEVTLRRRHISKTPDHHHETHTIFLQHSDTNVTGLVVGECAPHEPAQGTYAQKCHTHGYHIAWLVEEASRKRVYPVGCCSAADATITPWVESIRPHVCVKQVCQGAGHESCLLQEVSATAQASEKQVSAAASTPNAESCGPKLPALDDPHTAAGDAAPTVYSCPRRLTMCFYLWTVDGRGMPTSTLSYARFVEEVLGHRAAVIVGPDKPTSEDVRKRSDFKQNMLDTICERFPTRIVPKHEDVGDTALGLGCDVVYTQGACLDKTHPVTDQMRARKIKTVYHCFGWCHQVYADAHAVVSNWAAVHFRGHPTGPVIPYPVTECPEVPQSAVDKVRTDLGIPLDAPVVCTFGAASSFDLPSTVRTLFGSKAILENWMNQVPTLHLIQMPAIDVINRYTHPRIHTRPRDSREEVKTAFIKSCDAMLHARKIGESFGMAIAEFSRCNKPIITMNNNYQPGSAIGGYETAHVEYLGSKGWFYRPSNLASMVQQFQRLAEAKANGTLATMDFNAYRFAEPSTVMKQGFQKHFLEKSGACPQT